MKKRSYYAFSCASYYPEGGMNDYIGSFTSLKLAKEAVAKNDVGNDFGQIAEVQIDGSLKTIWFWLADDVISGHGRHQVVIRKRGWHPSSPLTTPSAGK